MMGWGWLLLMVLPIAGPEPCDLQGYRQAYREACGDFKNRDVVEGFLADMIAAAAECPGEPIAAGYQAAAGLMSAGLPWNPMEALQRFNEWTPVLEASIEAAPDNPDLRFLRLGVQTNVPAIVGYRGEIEGDLALIQAALREGHWQDAPAFEVFVGQTLSELQP